MKDLQELIKDLTGINVEEWKINRYLQNERLNLSNTNLVGVDLSDTYLRRSNLTGADLRGIKITKKQLNQLTIIEENE
ncbi:MAG: hypothetical protein SPLM_10400 [Spiroplasma phoeniceum]|uniref:pentapeptide repeat-containing protein n=1 Tax=Spiroplasma TaxID=2132 RepID=UPI000F85EC33|nr:pentapeptide repeat-containing protein [Spiroplasma endosymbiont of Megaselia nigra]RUO86193.1 hypothetical protein D9R21_04530 [Spiroplasma endosymbiont of Megaselia nigra]